MYAEVIVDILNSEVDRIFDYSIPSTMKVQVGMRVLVPFGARKIEGYLINIKKETLLNVEKVKDIIKIIDEKPLINQEMLELCFYLKNNNHLRLVDALRLVLPTQIRSGNVNQLNIRQLSLNDELVSNYVKTLRKNAIKPIQLINYLENNGVETFTILSKKFGNSVVNKLLDNGILKEKIVSTNRKISIEDYCEKDITLTNMQSECVKKVLSKEDIYLLHGVTGSGKTEVYLNIIKQVVENGKTAIMLVPEISLTPQMLKIFSSRFGDKVAILHSGLSEGERFDQWNRIKNGEASIVLGARSAIFAPVESLGVIIIDEEHDGSYQADNNPRYDAIDIAKWRRKYNKCSLLLGSATPSLESYYNAKNGKYQLLELPIRINNKEMPNIEIVDMSSEFRNGNATPFSVNLLSRLEKTINDGNQAILFINRRGFSSFLMCKSCGYIPKCENCDVSLVYHKFENELKCHYCGKRYKSLTVCPVCGSRELKLGGVGTQRVCEELRQIFPNVPIFRMDNDTTKNKNAHAKILNEFSKSKPAILVGTQMVAKGHDFSEVNLVGILDADLSLFFNDYKANEKTFQLVTQVAGRAGRSQIEGHVVLQTYFPKNYVYHCCANYDFKKFYEKEINLRQTTLFPPFSKVLRILITSVDDDEAKSVSHNIFMALKDLRIANKEDFYFLEGMKSPINKIKNKYRYQIVMRFSNDNDKKILDNIYKIVDNNKNRAVSTFVELSPQNLS